MKNMTEILVHIIIATAITLVFGGGIDLFHSYILGVILASVIINRNNQGTKNK